MPPPRRSSPRRKDRRSRSRSPSRERRRSRSPREKRRSRSPYKKRSRSRERGSSPKRRSPERSSPLRRKSLGTKRRSSSPHGYDQPVKRQADSTRRTYRSKSRSHSPVPQKKSRDSRRDDSPPEKVSSRRRSPSPLHSSKYSDRPSSSKSSDRRSFKKDEIDFVKIVDMGSKLPKLNKRFQTLEQLAQGGFEFEENITIGIHRGPSHLDLDEDVPVNYDFNPKLFIMLHPKKDYTIPVFERDEILAFHHDDVLDEEAYVEKRTITVKPSDKPKPTTSRSDNSRYKDIDYKITIGSSRESHGDRRMVHDSGSRSSRYDPEVKIRLDARPDPKYERLYKESRRQEERDLLDDNIQRNPSDLHYNLMRKKSSDDDRDRDRSRGRESYGDARARIEAKRKALSDRYDGSRDQSPPPTRLEKRKIGIKTELPDFKNRPDDEKPSTSDSFSKFHRWGYCEICNVPINSEKQAIEHVQGTKHIEAENEKKHGTDGRSNERKPTALFINGKRVLDGDEESIDPRFNRKNTYNNDEKTLWIVGTGEMKDLIDRITLSGTLRQAFKMEEFSFVWHCARCLKLRDVEPAVASLLKKGPSPSHIILHIGGYDLGDSKSAEFVALAKDTIRSVQRLLPRAKIIWNQLIPRFTGYKDSYTLNKDRREIDDQIARYILDIGGGYIRFPSITLKARFLYGESRDGDLTLSLQGYEEMEAVFTGGVRSIVLRDMKIVPNMKDLSELCSEYVRQHIVPILNKIRRRY